MTVTFVKYVSARDVVEFTFDLKGRELEGQISGEALDDHLGRTDRTAAASQVALEMEPERVESIAVKLVARGREPHIGTDDL
jgi:hypothetical protein